MKKSSLYFVGALLVLIIGFLIVQKVTSFSLFEEEKINLFYMTVPNEEYDIECVFVPSNAVTESSVVVKKVFKNSEEILKGFSKYNYVDDYYRKDKILYLVLSDTTSNLKDSIEVKL